MAINLENYQNFAKTRLDDIKAFFSGEKDVVVGIEILNGLHVGSRADLTANSIMIGSESSHDVMLVDDEVLGPALQVKCSTSLVGTFLTVTTDRTDVTMNGKPLRAWTTVRLPCEVGINDIQMRFTPQKSPRQNTHKVSEQFVACGLVGLAIAAFAGQAYLQSRNDTPGISMVKSASAGSVPEAAMHKVGFTSNDQDLRRVNTASAVNTPDTEIAKQIEAAGLADYIKVNLTQAGVVELSGQVPSEHMPTWKNLRQQIDSSASSQVILAKVSQTKSLTNLPPIAAISLGENSKVIFADGVVSHVGDSVLDNWTITSISEDKLQLSRGNEAVDVSF